jgi:hypothetical protein
MAGKGPQRRRRRGTYGGRPQHSPTTVSNGTRDEAMSSFVQLIMIKPNNSNNHEDAE